MSNIYEGNQVCKSPLGLNKSPLGLKCYVIGTSSLAIQCSQILMNAGYTLLGVMSEDPKVIEWATQQNICWTNSLHVFEAKLKETPFDYLFSIFNKFILPPSMIKMARMLTINCHDAPLPKYAGTHATSWAILNGEAYHGITWHTVVEAVDAGDILQQAIFAVDPNETAMSLNLKCYEHARIEFMKLVNKITENKLVRFAQDLQVRSFFSASKKPRGNAFIHWNSTAEKISALHRALDFGDYLNPLASPKFKFGENIIIPKQMSISTLSTQPAGTIIQIDAQSIEVATETRNIIFRECVDLTGQSVNLLSLASRWNIRAGYLLKSLTSACIEAIDKVSVEHAKHESFWLKQFIGMATSASQPFVDKYKKEQQSASKVVDLSAVFKTDSSINILKIFLIYFYRINGHQNLGFYFSDRKLKSIRRSSSDVFAEFVPLETNFTAETTFEGALQAVSELMEGLEKRGTYARDIFCRYPCLKDRDRIHWTVDIVDDLNESQANPLSSVTIAINHAGNKFRVLSNNALIYPNAEMLANAMTTHLSCLIDAINANHQESITHLNFIPDKELDQIQVQWNQTTANFPSHKTIVELFEKQVLKTPYRIAVSSAEEQLTYHLLNARANQLAFYLKKIMMTPETLVAVYLDRSVDTIVSILAVLKAGGAYVPVDVSYPKDYIQNILHNTPIVLTQKQYTPFLETCFSEKHLSHMVELDTIQSVIRENPSVNLEVTLSPQNLAYVIHTSGSTGVPKGVLVEHRSVINLAYSQIKQCQITEDSCILAFASFGFDASVFEIFCSLFSGAKLYVAKKEEIIPGESLLNTLQKNKISAALISPIALDITEPSQLPHLKALFSAGDACSAKINSQWNKEGILFLNGYGPTETTVFATVKVCKNKQVTPTIGKPIDNAVVYVLDEYYQPVPVGVMGELYIGGVGVARGYLNQPELTREKFIPNPFIKGANDPNQRLYRSGDLVRWLPDGDLEYGGRIDAQVKIRGYRIELSAIESTMQSSPLVQQSVVITLMDAKEHRYIVAYVVPAAPEQNFDLSTLRKYLVDKLPAYMIPQSFVVLNKLPINTSGKVDKKLLPLPKERSLLSDTTYVPPETEIEADLVQVWSQILNVENVGINDNFFNLGGHSLLVTEVLLHVKHAFKINISLKSFFDQPTISELAKLISSSHTNQVIHDLEDVPYLKYAVLAEEVQCTSSSFIDKNKIKSALLTGATGFLGSHLLYDLYSLSTAKIFCLIRAKDYGEALFRINKNLVKYGFRSLINSDRIIFLLGDLNEKNLGLSEEIFDMLAKEVDVIYHNGAVVNHICDYESLRKSNVDSTLELIRLASTFKPKKMHFISALNAAVDISHERVIKEAFPTDHTTPLDLHNGYCQTKWVSERLLAQAREKGLQVNIYRPSWIAGQLKTGIWEAQSNHLLNFIKSCIQLGYAPDKNFSLEMWPVDSISRSIVQISLNEPHDGVYNFTNPNTLTWHDLVAWLNKNGHPLTFMPVPEWRRYCFDHMTKKNALYPFAALYLQDSDWLSGLCQEKVPKVESAHTAAVLKSLGINYPRIDTAIFKVYFDYLYKIGFIQMAVSMQPLEHCA